MSGEFWAAVSGAIVGGLIAALVQWLAIQSAKHERQRALAFSLLFKIVNIHSNLKVLEKHIGSAFKHASADDLKNPCSIVMGLANSPNRVFITTEEFTLVHELHGAKILNEFLVMDGLHNSMLDSFQFYSERRLILMDSLSTEAVRFNGNVASADLNAPLRAKTIPLNQLIESLHEHLPDDVAKSLWVLQHLADFFFERLNVKFPVKSAPAAVG